MPPDPLPHDFGRRAPGPTPGAGPPAGATHRHYAKPGRQELARRYENRPLSHDEARACEELRAVVLATANVLVDLTPCCPEQTRALNALDHVLDLARAALHRHPPEPPDRPDGGN